MNSTEHKPENAALKIHAATATQRPSTLAMMEINRLREINAELLATLEAMLRCPGIDQTDQETGETFRTIASAALARANS